MTAELIIAIVVVVTFILLFKGMIKTFRRSFIGAILCLIFLFPIWLIWAFIEVFTGKIDKTVYVTVKEQE